MNILYISYDGALDPLGSSQIIPYLIGLSKKGINFTLLTYEKKQRLKEAGGFKKIRNILKNNNIKWEMLRYHKSPTAPATAFDVLIGFIKGLLIIPRDRIQLVHARSFVGAIPGLLLAKIFQLKFIFDMRGFWADERIDGSIWKNKNLLYKIAKWWEKIFLLNADWVVCLTEEAKKITLNFPYLAKRHIFIDVIPTCVDTYKFTVQYKNVGLLKRLKLENRFIFVYLGSIGTWYMLDEMIDFFKISQRLCHNPFFMFITPDKDMVCKRLLNKEIDPKDYFIDFIPYENLPEWLSLADASVSFIKPSYSKKSSCPTKFAESLACGIPVITSSGIGDCDKIINETKAGVLIDGFLEPSYLRAIDKVTQLAKNKEDIRRVCRQAAEKYFSLEEGVNKYLKIYQRLR